MQRLTISIIFSLFFLFVQGEELFCWSDSDGSTGLRLAWRRTPEEKWIPFEYDFVKNDFGPWGSHKKMYSPRLTFNSIDSLWTATWKATASNDVVASTTSPDLIHWSPQRYYAASSIQDSVMHLTSESVRADSAIINGRLEHGWSQHISPEIVDSLRLYVSLVKNRQRLFSQRASDDTIRFKGLSPVKTFIKADTASTKKISDKLIGIFFEDINYGADGGLYGELIQNRDFEYQPTDTKSRQTWSSTTAWNTEGDGRMSVDTVAPIHENNPHYIRLTGPITLSNSGYDGISVTEKARYRFSMSYRTTRNVKAKVCIIDKNGDIIASAPIKLKRNKNGKWTKITKTFQANATSSGCIFTLQIPDNTTIEADMISLFPESTFHGHTNGLRNDLAQKLADLKPQFVRFPGGCVAHGNGIDNIYDWKGSIGPIENRRPLRNLWGYHQTRGLGYHEFFEFCEDIGAEPLPVVAAGVPCQNSGLPSHHSHDAISTFGQQGGIPWSEMSAYIQDILDLIEYANGDPATSRWAQLRADAGHPEPFGLKYLGIGNEDLISEVFVPRYKMIYEAVRKHYPEIQIVGTAGPFYEGSDYEAGWQLARETGTDLIDEHYYVEPGWLIYNQTFYDNYDRQGPKVYLGEWAAHLPGRPNNIETALAGALYLTSVERNADVVEMTSYAPLLARRGHTQWRPDLIYFDNDSITLTPDYYVQYLFGNNTGDSYIPAEITVEDHGRHGVSQRIGVSIVEDSDSGDMIFKLVNMLPVDVTAEIDLSSLGIRHDLNVDAVILCGHPSDRNVSPKTVQMSLSHPSLPPYSFTLMRINKQNF